MSRFDDRYGKTRHPGDDSVWTRPAARRDDDTRYPGDEFGGTYGHRDLGGRPYDAGHDVAGGRDYGPGDDFSGGRWAGQRDHRRNNRRYPGGLRGVGPKGYERSDERIREDICERLTEHDAIDASNIEVRVAEGVVQLSGEVPERYMKHLAEDAVVDAVGVKDVDNTLRVRGRNRLEDRGMFDEPSLG